MKPTCLIFAALLTSLPVLADSDIAINVQQGYVSSSALTTTGTTEGVGYLNNGNTATGSDTVFGAYYPTIGNGNYGQVISIYENASLPIVSLNFYDALWSDGGWFGSGSATNGTLSSSVLTAPILQYTTSPYDDSTTLAAATWATLTPGVDYTDNYVSALTGAAVGASSSYSPYANNSTAVQGVDYSAPISVETTFTLTTPLTGVTGIRLVGPAGGTAGIISSYELQVESPEPSTYAMIFCGMGMLVLIVRLRRQLSV